VKHYERHHKDRFADLPPPVQTAVESLHYQNGKRINTKFKPVMKEVHKGDFPKAATVLRKTPDPYRARRRMEAKLMASARPRGVLGR
jgi:hypothetical protein